jgi:hypothetical protein
MSEIADELERLAKELDEAADQTHAARELPKYKDLGQVFAGTVTGYRKSADRLRERAAELRRPAPVGLPKPAQVLPMQRWRWTRDCAEYVVDWIYKPPAHAAALRNGHRSGLDVSPSELLTNNEWLYLGDGPEPAR